MRRLALFILVAVIVIGCDDGAQHGQFAVCSHSSRTVQGGAGQFMVLRGNPLPLTPTSNCAAPLLCVLVLGPFNPSGRTGADNATYLSTCESTYCGAKLVWDRRDDKVSAGGITFDRKKGNAFVLISNGSIGVTLSQVTSLVGSPTDAAALQQLQAALPAASPAKGIALVP